MKVKGRLLFNPNAGRARAQGIGMRQLLDCLRMHDIEAMGECADGIDGVPPVLDSLEQDDLLIIAGGDGTVYEAVQHPNCLQVRLAIIPLGTANNLATTARIPMDIDNAAKVVLQGKERRIDLGRINGHIFTQAAGVGFHAEAFRIYEGRLHDILHGTRAVISTLEKWKPVPMRISVDDKVFEKTAIQVTVANTPIYGNKYHIAQDALVDDGLLDVVIVTGCRTKPKMLGCIMRLMEGKALDASNYIRVLGKKIIIEPISDIHVPVHADAMPIGYAPVTVEVLPSCLRLLVPK